MAWCEENRVFYCLGLARAAVKAGVTTLCPCSKAISDYGAHNQRGLCTVQIRSRKAVWIEDLIAIVEGAASSELYSLLKRQDEKAVTDSADACGCPVPGPIASAGAFSKSEFVHGTRYGL